MASFQLLDQPHEDDLHKSRLLNVEEKPFKRITKRIFSTGSLLTVASKLPPTPPPDHDAGDGAAEQEILEQKTLEERRQFREDILLDFAAFDSSIARIQFLRNSNERERKRYATEKIKILETAQAVRDNTALLRSQLEDAKKTLEQRKKFDDLAEKILVNKLLRPREDQEVNLRKLEEECKELERESQAYSKTWSERREQFGRIVEEGMQMRRLIRDEKEEVERREGMDGEEEDGEVGETGSRGGATPRHSSQSGNATPRPDDPHTPHPRSSSGAQTPAHHEGTDGGRSDGLKPPPFPAGTSSRPGSRSGSRQASPVGSESRRKDHSEDDDIPMEDTGPKPPDAEVLPDTPMIESLGGSATDVNLAERPEVNIDEASEDKMDTT
ncbi:MAG: hypothetical protein M1818_005884 [Claussenomyces sp. TS43310]|nr:MAG: hypothetical protein M1818_005884 [Claussenomyces sp. TS43310]